MRHAAERLKISRPTSSVPKQKFSARLSQDSFGKNLRRIIRADKISTQGDEKKNRNDDQTEQSTLAAGKIAPELTQRMQGRDVGCVHEIRTRGVDEHIDNIDAEVDDDDQSSRSAECHLE